MPEWNFVARPQLSLLYGCSYGKASGDFPKSRSRNARCERCIDAPRETYQTGV